MDQAERSAATPDAIALDNVELELPFAGVGSRILAAFLDSLLLVVIWFALMVMATAAFALMSAAGVGGTWIVVVLVAAMFIIQWGYWAVVEVAMGGQTPGKKLIGLRTVNRTGGAASTGALVVRNLVRFLDLFVGIPLMAFDSSSRRLGDRLAGTVVIHDRPEADPVMLRRLPVGWGRRQVALVESLVRRQSTLDVSVAQDLARRVLSLAERDDPAFLASVPADLAPTERVRVAFGVDRS